MDGMAEFHEWAGVRSGILVPFDFCVVLGIGTSAGQSGGGQVLGNVGREEWLEKGSL